MLVTYVERGVIMVDIYDEKYEWNYIVDSLEKLSRGSDKTLLLKSVENRLKTFKWNIDRFPENDDLKIKLFVYCTAVMNWYYCSRNKEGSPLDNIIIRIEEIRDNCLAVYKKELEL